METDNTVNGIKYLSDLNINNSYAHSVLQSLYSLSCIREYFLDQQDINNFFNYNFSRSFYFLLKSLKNGCIADSSNTIDNYIMTAKENASKTDPFNFLLYFLEQLHIENNKPSNINYNYSELENVDLITQTDDNKMYSLFCSFFQSTQNSIISQKFFNILKFKKYCNQCNNTFYKFEIEKIFKFDIDKYFQFRNEAIPAKANNPKLDLDECFQCYTGAIPTLCPNCQNYCAMESKKFYFASEILIIYFYRKNHCFRGDIDFKNTISISNYYSTVNSNNNNKNTNINYFLKACISFSNNNKYFADCFMPCNNDKKGIWMRYMDGEKRKLDNFDTEIHEYEPQILIYELENLQNQNNINFMDFIQQQLMFKQQCQQFIQNFNNINAMQQNQLQMSNNNNINNNNNFYNISQNNINNNINNSNYNPIIQNSNNEYYFCVKFICVPEFGNQFETTNNTILVPTNKDDTINKVITKFYSRLGQNENSIKYFILNETALDKNSQLTLEACQINSNSVIKAIKSNYFKEYVPI